MQAQTGGGKDRQALAKGNAQPQAAPVPANGSTALTRFGELPAAFAGVPREGAPTTGGTADLADGAHVAMLKENGFTDASTAHYAGVDGAHWTLQIFRFGDATGAYSAYTFYRQPDMQTQQLGDNSAANGNVFLVRDTATVIRAERQGGTAPAAGDLLAAMRVLVGGLPKLHGPEAIAPSLPAYLPKDGLQRETIHYATGPAAYNGALPPNVLNFEQDAEAATAHYSIHGHDAILTLVMFPTPQLAGAAERRITALPDASLHAGTRRIGPLLGVAGGAGLSAADAAALLGKVNYRSDVVMNQPQGYISEVAKTAKLLLSIGELTGILAVASVLLALFLGGGRVLLRRLQGKPPSSLNDEQFIRLKINE